MNRCSKFTSLQKGNLRLATKRAFLHRPRAHTNFMARRLLWCGPDNRLKVYPAPREFIFNLPRNSSGLLAKQSMTLESGVSFYHRSHLGVILQDCFVRLFFEIHRGSVRRRLGIALSTILSTSSSILCTASRSLERTAP